MSLKDIIVGASKQLVGEIVGDGWLAQEGSRQVRDGSDAPACPPTGPSSMPPLTQRLQGRDRERSCGISARPPPENGSSDEADAAGLDEARNRSVRGKPVMPVS